MMTYRALECEGLLLLEPKVFPDDRGCFAELWNEARFFEETGIETRFVQDNVSWSRRGVLRGLHFQNPQPQGKLVSVLEGRVYDIAVDLRQDSATFGDWVGVELDSENLKQLYIPEGFAHGFQVLSESAIFHYKCTAYYHPAGDGGVRWDDPDIGIRWPPGEVIISPKDAGLPYLRDLPAGRLFGTGSGKAER